MAEKIKGVVGNANNDSCLAIQYAFSVWGHAPPGKFLKTGTLRSLLRPFLGQNVTPPVVSVAREAIKSSCETEMIVTHDAYVVSPSPICALGSPSSIAIYIKKLRSLNSLTATLDA